MQESAGYPSSTSRLPKEVFDKILELPENGGSKMDLEWFKQHVWNETCRFEVPEDQVICGMQANIFKINLYNAQDEVFKLVGKRVVPSELPSKANMELWQDFLNSVKREVSFYKDKSSMNPDLFPKVFYSSGFQNDSNIMSSFYFILMKDVSDDYFQQTGVNKTQATDLMNSLAKFHATHWNRIDPEADRGTFWVLNRRKPLREVENADKTWKTILERFPHFNDLYPGVQDIASRLASKADELDTFVSSQCITQVHGDCKGWNVFFRRSSKGHEENSSPVLFIDMQWTGIGHPLQDVAYALTTTLEPECLPEMDNLVDVYLDTLSKQVQGGGVEKDRLKRDFDLVWLDYARVIITGLWKRFSPEQIVKNQSIVGPSYIGRSVVHAEFIIKRIKAILDTLDNK